VRFDALQVFLINASVTVAASSRASRATRVASSAAAGPCDSQASDVVTDLIPLGRWVISLVGPVKDRAKVAALALDAIHGMVLAFSVAAAPTTRTSAKTHYGPAGHDGNAGKPFDFGVRVIMRDQLPRFVISCGPLLGMKFPEKGPIPGIIVAWKDESAIAAPLISHGTVTFPTGRKTNANGETSLHFGPKDEKLPGFGSVHYSANAATGVALYQSAFKNVPGSVAQFLTPKSVTFDWSVSFHLARGFKFVGTVCVTNIEGG
jgi:hypothetical protein